MLNGKTLGTSLVVLASAFSAAQAERVLVGSEWGTVVELDTDTGLTTFRGVCGGPITSMASAAGSLYLGDTWGRVYILDLETDLLTGNFMTDIDVRALAATEEAIFVGGADGELQRFDPETYEMVGSAVLSWTDISSLVIVGNELFSGGLSTFAQRAPIDQALDTSAQTFFAACGGSISSMAAQGEDLFLGATNGSVYRYGMATGSLGGYYQAGVDSRAMIALPGGRLLIADSDGTVVMTDPIAEEIIAEFDLNMPIGGMLLISEPTCAADIDNSGSVDIDDVLAFIDAAATGNASADLDGSGSINVDDMLMFVDLFTAGCP